MKKFLKDNKGLAASDGLLALLIVTLFTGIIATLIFSIYVSNTSLKRMSIANSYLVDVLEYVDSLYYDELTVEKIQENPKYEALQELTGDDLEEPEEGTQRVWRLKGEVEKGYILDIIMDKYAPEENTLDLVRKITVRVNYSIGNRNQNIEIVKLKSRENLEVPNRPDISRVYSKDEVEDGDVAIPIKLVDEYSKTYVVCKENDIKWYQYTNRIDNSNTAKVLISDRNLNIGEQITLEEIDNYIFEWIPRYVTVDGKTVYLYGKTNSTVENQDGYNVLVDTQVEAGATFKDVNDKELTGNWQEYEY